ncbi:hypothetical protein [Candidatus Solirubrobacter pratensis]|uniref:hypothetical protein n=1 Tax=Candidatus Solirubrobacter pratensis TaxID=1298857 RepID=UPI0003F73B91|nr:hypothetical protein [Candidatus Solirubrobacter pratensis]
MAGETVVVEHPNRGKASSQLTRLLLIVLLLASAALVAIVTLGGWDTLEGAKPVQVAYVLIYLVLAVFVARWTRGVLPMIAALAIILGIFAVIATPAWFDRTRDGFSDPGLSSGVLGLVCGLLVPVQAALIVLSLQAFRQEWNVEVERAPAREPAAA